MLSVDVNKQDIGSINTTEKVSSNVDIDEITGNTVKCLGSGKDEDDIMCEVSESEQEC